MSMYYEIGEYLSKRVELEKWGSKTIDLISEKSILKESFRTRIEKELIYV